MPSCVGFTYGGTAQSRASAPADAASMPMAIAAEVARAVQPAITGTRPDAASATVFTARAYSDRISEAASPVLPQTIRQAVPRSTRRSARRDKAVQSTRVSTKGVTSAVDEPPTP